MPSYIYKLLWEILQIIQTGKYYDSRDIKSDFGIKDILKIVSENKMKNCLVCDRSGITFCISLTVNWEPIQTVYKKTIYVYLFIWKRRMSKLSINMV